MQALHESFLPSKGALAPATVSRPRSVNESASDSSAGLGRLVGMLEVVAVEEDVDARGILLAYGSMYFL